MQENESNVITKRMSELLVMSDVLISSIDLEDLLGEIVSGWDKSCRVKNVALLYMVARCNPLALPQWSDQQQLSMDICLPALTHSMEQSRACKPCWRYRHGGDLKMAAIPAPARFHHPRKRSAIRAPKLTSQTEQSGLHSSHIPRPALRDLDMILARMAMRAENWCMAKIYKNLEDRGEAWCRMALAAATVR